MFPRDREYAECAWRSSGILLPCFSASFSDLPSVHENGAYWKAGRAVRGVDRATRDRPLLARISHTHGPKCTPGNRNLLTRKTVTGEARIPIDLTACRIGSSDFQLVAVKKQVSQVRHHPNGAADQGTPTSGQLLCKCSPAREPQQSRCRAGKGTPTSGQFSRWGPAPLREAQRKACTTHPSG